MNKPTGKTAAPRAVQRAAPSSDIAHREARGGPGSASEGLQQSPRQLAQRQALQQAFGPVAQLRSPGDPLHGHDQVSVQPGEGVIQAQWETALAWVLGSAVTALAGLAVAAYHWWPAGWSRTQLRTLNQYVALGDLLAFAALPWTPAAVIGLGQAYAAAPNNLNAAEWLAIAQALPANATADAVAFARIAGWNAGQINPLVADYVAHAGVAPAAGWAAMAAALPPASWASVGTLAGLRAQHAHLSVGELASFAALPWAIASIGTLVQAFAVGPNNLTAAEWAAIAAQLPANGHADTAAFAQIAGWNAAELTLLVTDYMANAALSPVASWVAVAAQLPPASWAIVGTLAAPLAPLSAAQINRGNHIYLASGNQLVRVQAWVNRGARAAMAPMLPLAHPAGGLAAPPFALDLVLGPGAHVLLRGSIVLNGQPYSANPFVRQHAQTLVAAAMSVANTRLLLNDFCTHINNQVDFDQAVAVAVVLSQNNVVFAELRNFFLLHLATAVQPALLPAIQDLSTRPNVTAALLDQVLTTLAPMGHPALLNFLTTELANTANFTLARLAARVAYLTNPAGVPLVPGLGLAPAAIVGNQFTGLFQSLNMRVANGSMSLAASNWIKHAYKLLSQADQAGMLGFISSVAVLGTLNNGPATNAAYWLYKLAQQHAGAPPGGFAAVNVPVMAGGAMRTIVIDNNIIQHVLERHSYEHFRLTLPIINRHVTSALFTAAQTPLTVTNSITASITSATFTGQHPWPLGVDIQVGALQLRLAQVAPNTYRLTQYFIQVAPGLAHDVTQGVLLQIRHRFPFLVY